MSIAGRGWRARLESMAAARWAPCAVGAVLVVWCGVLLPFWSLFELNPDEGGNLAKSMLVVRGFRLYRDIWSDQPPLVTWLGAGLVGLTGPSIVAARLLVLGFAVLLIAHLFALLRRRSGGIAALAGTGLVMLAPSIAVLSVSFMIGLVSISLFVAALASLLRADDGPAHATAWLALAGLLAGLALAAKLFVLPLLGLLGLYALQRHGWRGLVYAAALFATTALLAWPCGVEAWPQLAQPHVVAFEAAAYRDAIRVICLKEHLGLFVLAAVGAVPALRRREWLPVACLAYGVAVLLLHRPFHAHHMVLVAVPAAWLSGLAVAAGLAAYDRAAAAHRRRAAVCGGLALVALAGIGVFQLRESWRAAFRVRLADQRGRADRHLLVSSLRAYAGDNPWLLTDRPMYALQAGLQVLPELAIISDKRMTMLHAGPPGFFNRLLEQYRHPQVLLLRHDDYPPVFGEQLQREYVRLAHGALGARHFVQAAAIPAPPPLDDFAEALKHVEHDGPPRYARHSAADFPAIAETILQQQELDGGWLVNLDPLQCYDAPQREALARRHAALARQFEQVGRRRDQSPENGSSLDNGATVAQIRYLLRVYGLAPDPRYRAAAMRGIEYLLASQSACGAWPHSFPPTRPYQARLTMLDDATLNPLRLLREVAAARPPFDPLPESLRRRAAAAHARGLDCLLRLQIRIDGAPAGWAGQYDPRTLEPAHGRSFELPGLTSRETVDTVEYLMTLDDPPPAVVASIEGAVRWLRAVQLDGLELRAVAAAPDAAGAADVVLAAAPDAPPLWARFYEIPGNRPFVAERGGRKLYDFAALSRERRVGYEWYGRFATTLLTRDYPAWQARRAPPVGTTNQGTHDAGGGLTGTARRQ